MYRVGSDNNEADPSSLLSGQYRDRDKTENPIQYRDIRSGYGASTPGRITEEGVHQL